MATTRRTSFIALGAALLLPGCVIAPYGTYYRPSTPHGAVEWRRAYCSGKAGPTTRARLDLGGGLRLEIASVLDPGDRQGLSIDLGVDLPPRTTLSLSGPFALEIDGRAASERFTDPVYGSRAPGPGDRWQAGETMTTGASGGRVTLEAFLPQPGERVRIVWPATRLNGQAWAWPELALERRRFDGGIEPFNC